MRSIINKCKERAAALKEQMAREQSSQMTINQNDLYFLNQSNGSMDPNMGGRQQSFQYNLQQQLQQFSGQNPQLQGQQQNLQRFLAQKLNFHNMSQEMIQQNRFQMSPQLQQKQELLHQNQFLAQNPNSQKQNTMLMNMLRDLPAANQSQAINLLKQQQQQQLQQQLQLKQLQYLQQQQQQQQSQQKPKKPRKRKITSDNMTRSPGSSTGKSPKRKMSDDDLPDDGLTPDAFQWTNDSNSVCRPSSTPSSSASFSETIGNIKQELNLPGGMTTTTGGGDTMGAYYLNQRMAFDGSQNDFNDFNPSELSLYGESGGDVMISEMKPSLHLDMNQSLISAKSANKRTAKRMRSDASDETSATGDDSHNEQLKIIKSLEDLHQKETFSKFFPSRDISGDSPVKKTGLNNAKLAKASNKNDVRRCSSAGIEVGSDNKKGLLKGFENIEDITELSASLKKERKRKRAESVDSLKGPGLCSSSTAGKNQVNSSNICSESAMMPPPMIGSIGDVSSSSSLSSLDANLRISPKMSPTSSSAGSSPSHPVMKISSLGNKKSLIGSTVSSTSGEVRISKISSNKMDKNAGLSSMLKSPKQSHIISPKASDSEGISSVATSLSPKGLTFKSSKVKPSKSGLTTSPARTKDHNRSQVIPGMKQKSGNISSTSAMSLSKGGTAAVSSSSSLSSGMPSSAGSSVSSSKQHSAKLAKISRKSSLTAVVDRLHQKQDATGVTPGQPAPANENGRPESSNVSSNRPDTTCTPKVSQSGSNKLTEPKTKYPRSSDQFTIKQNNSGGGLKISLTKTKLSSADNTNKIGPGGTGLFKSTATSKFTIPKLPKTNTTSSPSANTASLTTTSSATPAVSGGTSVKRQLNTIAGKVSTGVVRPNVSSSTHPTGPSVSPKANISGFNTPHIKPSFGDRHGSKMGANPMAHKNPAINRMLDKFKSNPEPSSTTKTTAQHIDISSTPSNSYQPSNKPVAPIAEPPRPAIYSKFDNVTVPMPVGYSRSISTSSVNSPQLPASTTLGFQTNKPIFSRSHSVNENENMDRLLSTWSSTIESGANETSKEVISKNKVTESIASPLNPIEKAGVSSSSDVKASTSTPSSPAEMALISDAQNPPPLIPTEAIDDSSEGGSGGSASVEGSGNADCDNSTPNAIDSTDLVRESGPSNAFIGMVSAIEPSNEVSTSDIKKSQSFKTVDTNNVSSLSKHETPVVSESSKTRPEDDDDGDGLVIDDPSVPPKPSRPTVSGTDAVSSSTSRLTNANESQSPSKVSTSPTSSSTPIVASNPILSTISGTSFSSSVTSPSNLSTNGSMHRASPYPIADIDDDLMDEALVGSNE